MKFIEEINMLYHIVIFWLKDDLTNKKIGEFCAGLETLKKIENVNALYIGKVAKTAKRAVVDHSFDIGVSILFDSVEEHDKYQVNPLHTNFREKFSSFWSRVLMYDFE